MKKFIVIFTMILVMFVENVNAADPNCQVTMQHYGVGGTNLTYSINGSTRSGTLYIAWLKDSNGTTALSFCLDRGYKSVHNGIYVRTTDRAITVTNNMRKAYYFATGVTSGTGSKYSNYSTPSNTLRYLIAQTAIWLDQEGAYSMGNISAAAATAFYSYYEQKGYTRSDAYEKFYPIYNQLIQEYINLEASGIKYTAPLYTFEYIDSDGRYQRFLSPLPVEVCPPEDTDRTYCPSPNEGIDITECINNNQDKTNPEQYCIDLNCPDTEVPACEGGVLVVARDHEYACANDNQNHSATYYETVDYSQCGYADQDGEPIRLLGSWAYLYCKERVTRSFPGGISSPISLGTSFVWPTSSATEHTVWGNLYSLSYVGYKDCKIKVAPNTRISENPRDTIRNYQNILASSGYRFDYVRRDYGGACSSAYGADLTAATNTLNSKKEAQTSAQAAYDKAISDYNNAKSQLDAAIAERDNKITSEQNSCRSACDRVGSTLEIVECRKDCDKIKGNITSQYSSKISTLQSAVNSLGSSVTTAGSNLGQANNAVTTAQSAIDRINNNIRTCNEYMTTYNSAIQLLNDISAINGTTFNATDLYQFESSTSMAYDDPEYGASYTLIGATNYSCSGCEGGTVRTYSYDIASSQLVRTYDNLKTSIEERVITVEASVSYSLPDNLYYYVDKRTNRPLMTPTDDYITIGYSNLPTSFNASVRNTYNLSITINSLGEDGKFTSIANENPYVCNYTLSTAQTDECVCPEGTKHAGEDLYCKIYSASTTEETMTCADAQILYCDSDETFDEICDDEKFCPGDRSIKITSCLNSGYSYNYCVDNLCSLTDDYHCPRGTYNDGMDIKPCVFANIGLGLENAIEYCQNTVCPGQGLIIIYRPISLRNPFPGKYSAETGITIDFSLDNLKGRYPGANWNSKLLVETQILYNRGVEGNEVYNKEPLYSFILDGDTIRQIREYNDSRESSGGYADFTLECNSNGVACLSKKFLRESNSGLIGGVCSSTSWSEFYICSES